MVSTSIVNDKSALVEFGIDISTIKFIKPAWKRSRYQAIINWLTKYKTQLSSSTLEPVRGYIEVLYHLCELKEWIIIQRVFRTPLPINPSTLNITLPLYEYLLFREFSRELLVISEDIIDSLRDSGHDITFVKMLKARAMSAISDKLEDSRKLFEELFHNTAKDTEIHIEALAYLGIRQVNSGFYQEGIKNLQDTLIKIDSNEQFLLNQKTQELKTDILENLAFCEMNSSHFQEAIQLYKNVIDIRNDLDLSHKLAHPSAHLGIIMRKIGKYEEALYYLETAKEKAKLVEIESQTFWINHHLAYVLLNRGQPNLAEKLCINSIEGYKKLKNLWGESDCYEQLGLIDLAMGRFKYAEKNFDVALRMRQSLGNLHGTASSVLDLALALWHQRRFIKAVYYLFKGFYLYYKLGVLNATRFRRMIKLSFDWTLGKRRWTM
jgi:tetratricopeptide (TPR) repeat protein